MKTGFVRPKQIPQEADSAETVGNTNFVQSDATTFADKATRTMRSPDVHVSTGSCRPALNEVHNT